MSELLALIHPALGSIHGAPFVVFLIVFFLTLGFLVGYLIQGSRVGKQLHSSIWQLKALKTKGGIPDPADVSKIFDSEPLTDGIESNVTQ